MQADPGLILPPLVCLQYTLLIYLSACEGGETVFYGAPGCRYCDGRQEPAPCQLHAFVSPSGH